MKPKLTVSDSELAILEVLWSAGSALNAGEIRNALNDHKDWERTTVRSLLTRLQEKGSVQVDKDADVATYAPNFTREEYGWDLAEVLVDRLYDKDARTLVTTLIAHGMLKKEDLAGL